jgi:DNA-binding GntR family transcriptional regulator
MTDRTALSEKVYRQFLRQLLDRMILPGQEFNRRQLAREMGVSPAPVAEALLRLQHEGLVEARARQGTRVRVPTLEDVRGQILLREAIECEAARWYCGEPLRQHHRRLLRLAQKVDRSDNAKLENWRDDLRFHQMLVDCAGIEQLSLAFERIGRLSTFITFNMLIPNVATQPRASHVAMLDALAIATPDEAEEVVRLNLRTGKYLLFVTDPTTTAEPPTSTTPAWLA